MPRFDRLEFDEQPDLPPDGMEPGHALGGPNATRTRGCARPTTTAVAGSTKTRCGITRGRSNSTSRSLSGWLGQVQMLVLLGEYPEAELWAKKSLELFNRHGDLMAGRAQALGRIGDRTHGAGACRRGPAARRELGVPLDGSRRAAGDRLAMRSTATASTRPFRPIATGSCRSRVALIYLYHEQPSKALLRARAGRREGARSLLRLVDPGTMRAGARLRPAGEDELRALPGAVATPRRGEPQAGRGRATRAGR